MSDEKSDKPDKPAPVPVQPVVAGTVTQLFLRWLFEQGSTVVVLILILGVSYYSIPKVLIPTIHDGYRQNAESLQKSAETYTKSNEKIATLIMENAQLYMENAQTERRALQRAVEAIEKRSEK
jgi:hypothetical protein